MRNLNLIPNFALTISCLEKRRPLALTARRSGWVGCNILLSNIPVDARIPLVVDGNFTSPSSVRHQFARLQPLEKLGYERRGWALDVLNVVRSLRKQRFYLADIYRHKESLQLLHPENLHIREKIRQQLQRLRDMGFIEFLGHGSYQLKS